MINGIIAVHETLPSYTNCCHWYLFLIINYDHIKVIFCWQPHVNDWMIINNIKLLILHKQLTEQKKSFDQSLENQKKTYKLMVSFEFLFLSIVLRYRYLFFLVNKANRGKNLSVYNNKLGFNLAYICIHNISFYFTKQKVRLLSTNLKWNYWFKCRRNKHKILHFCQISLVHWMKQTRKKNKLWSYLRNKSRREEVNIDKDWESLSPSTTGKTTSTKIQVCTIKTF